MNSLDSYEVSGPQPGQPSLNEEVSQVVGSLGKLWGGFRKQSINALETAKKSNFAQVVTQAQKELSTEISWLAGTNAPASTTEPEASLSTEPETIEPAAAEKADGIESSPQTPRASAPELPSSPTMSSLFARLQASIPPTFVSTVQANLSTVQANLSTVQATLPESLRQGADLTQLRATLTSEFQRVQGLTRAQAEQAAASLDLAQIRSTLSSEFQRVQDGARAQAEGYAPLLRDAVQGAGDFLKDAVKVIPPEGQTSDWDGNDLWMMDVGLSTGLMIDAGGKGKGKAVNWSSPVEAKRAVATRAQALLRKLRHDPSVLKVDPAEGDDKLVREMYESWVKEAENADGGLEGKIWTARIESALGDKEDGEALKTTLDALVPKDMTKDTFWTRYFFRVYQIEREEERRKALLQETMHEGDEEVFSWEDEDETAPATDPKATTAAAPRASLSNDATVAATVTSLPSTPALTSPRLSNEGSYDVVSSVASEPPAKDQESDEEEDDDDDEEEDESDEDSDEEEEEEEVKPPVGRAAPPKPAKPPIPGGAAKGTAKGKGNDSDSDWE